MMKPKNSKCELATFAGGCFWCVEAAFKQYEGVLKVISGYTGGKEKNPTYEEVSIGKTGHLEAIRITYNPKEISYQDLLEIFWRQIDPTDSTGSFVDRGLQYKSAIFYHNKEQERLAKKSKRKLEDSGKYDKPIFTEIRKATKFYPAEEYHQNYYKKNPIKYKLYKYASGRDQYRNNVWGKNKDYKPSKSNEKQLSPKLTKLQYQVTQEDATEQPFNNKYWDNEKEGIYVDIVSGEPLFSSKDKYKSETGWPSFTKPLEKPNIVEIEDKKLFMKRTEVRSKKANSHLGHVFKDGPKPKGLRYCINSAALKFIPKKDLEKKGYKKYKKLFKSS